MNKKRNVIVELTFTFALKIIEFCEILDADGKYVIGKQLLKSGTSIGANIREAQNAESKNDFIHKFKIAAKEIEETMYWLELVNKSNSYPDSTELIEELISIHKVTNKIIATSKSSNH